MFDNRSCLIEMRLSNEFKDVPCLFCFSLTNNTKMMLTSKIETEQQWRWCGRKSAEPCASCIQVSVEPLVFLILHCCDCRYSGLVT